MVTSREKGNVLEDIVALLHRLPGIEVETRVQLPSVRKGSSRMREIDVLLTSYVAGYPIRIAIECKNYKDRIKSEAIDAFLGKLEDVGIPPSNGIFVTATGYRSDALELAREAGIRPLVLEGLNRERLGLEVSAAIQSVVFHVAKWDTMSRFSSMGPTAQLPAPITVVDFPEELGEGTPSIVTLLYLLWDQDEIPFDLGMHSLGIRMPKEFRFSPNEQPMEDALVWLCYRVAAHVGVSRGTSSAALLRNVDTEKVEKFHVHTDFEESTGPMELQRFETEEDLQAFLGSAKLGIVTRVKVPRVVGQMSFWPPSRRATEEIKRRRDRGEEPTFEEIEGVNLDTAWEPSIYDED